MLEKLFVTTFLLLFVFSCTANEPCTITHADEDSDQAVTNKRREALDRVRNELGATKYINNCDYDHNAFKPFTHFESNNASVELEIDRNVKVQGYGSHKLIYHFAGKNIRGLAEKVYMQQVWYDKNRSDLSFHPLAISLWIKGEKGNDDIIKIRLLQQNAAFSLSSDKLYEFVYSDSTILNNDGWQQLIVPYEWFISETNNAEAELNLSRVAGLNVEIENGDLTIDSGVVYIDAIQQLTSFKPELSEPARFTSIFVQPSTPTHDNYDWETLFSSYKEVGIDSVIFQWSARHNVEKPTIFYVGSKITWKVNENNIIDQAISAAEKVGMKIVLGINHVEWPEEKGDQVGYQKIFDLNKEVFDELLEKFGESTALAGWYLSEEFHDGAWRGWLRDSNRKLLANHLAQLSGYIKSKSPDKVVCVAPALWRGRPADMTYTFYKSIFERTPDIDILYLQDCGGRCDVDEDDYDVYLPQFFEMIKKACDETGVQFGVDIESFNGCRAKELDPERNRSWGELKPQLDMAGLFTKNITQFSWSTFRPGVGAFDEYKKYMEQKGLLNN